VVYVALAIFNTFFKLPTYDSAYNTCEGDTESADGLFYGLDGSAEDEPCENMEDTEKKVEKHEKSAEDEPEDMEDTEVSADKSAEDEDMEDMEMSADKSAEDEDMEDTEVSAEDEPYKDIEDTGRVEEVSADKSAEDQYECLNPKRCLNGTTITTYLE
ncbi:hypothetical protein BGX38DRAFT_773129, partial [Terfezia claveryi]